MRVLIVEDEWIVAAALRRQVESHGHVVVGTAGTGREALRLCRAESPDLVLMDVEMPEMDGIEATRQLMEHSPVCVVIVTGKGQFDQAVTRTGAMSYVTKPLLTNQIPTVVQGALYRFDRFMDVYHSAPTLQAALGAWHQLQLAIGRLMGGRAFSEEEAYTQLEQMARARGTSLAEAAGLVAADGEATAAQMN